MDKLRNEAHTFTLEATQIAARIFDPADEQRVLLKWMMPLRLTLVARSAGPVDLTSDDLKCVADAWHPDKAADRDNTVDQTNARLF